MPIAKKKTAIKASKGTSSKSSTPRVNPDDIGLDPDELNHLHSTLECAKIASDAAKTIEAKRDLQDAARKRIFGNGQRGAFRVQLEDGKTLLVKPSSRRYALDEQQAEAIEEVIEKAGFDAGEYYHESHEISIDANIIFERLGEDEYMRFQAQLGSFLSSYVKNDGKIEPLGDCWGMKETIIAREDFDTKRHALGKKVNLKIEEIKPMTISIEAKREL